MQGNRGSNRGDKLIVKLTTFIGLAAGLFMAAAAAQDTQRPNLIVIVVDDQRWDEYGAAGHAYLETPNIDRLAAEGVLFTSSYAVSPLCSPNRASILTGQYISRHGIVDNIARDASSHRLPLFAQSLQEAGYTTAHVGKWHMGNDPTPRPGYDYWVSYPGQGRSINPEIFEDGRVHEVEGYMTDVLTDRAVGFIREYREGPFFLYIGHKALHPEVRQLDDASVDIEYGSKYQAAPRHVGTYSDKVFPRRPNTSYDMSGKPVIEEALTIKTSDETRAKWGSILDADTSEDTIRDRSEMLLAVDEGLGRLLGELEDLGILENTAILMTSDNGYWYGEHGLSVERRLPYEEGIRVPLFIRYPPLAVAGQTVDRFALSIDIAPTVLDLGGAEIGDHIQGESLLPLLTDSERAWRDSFLVEYTSYEKPMEWLIDTSYKAIRSGPWKYIHWIHKEGVDELYNLDDDPYEIDNIIDDPGEAEILAGLKARLAELVAEAVGL
jgi:N-acetylglucosamine-6-sulfatase